METEEVIKKRKEIEATGNTIPELEKLKQEPKKPRNVRRLEKSKKSILDELVLKFFIKRSALNDSNGTESAYLFDEYDSKWKFACTAYNRGRTPIKLRYEAFSEAVEFYLKMERDQIIQTAEANKLIGFEHWMRRSHVWRTRPLTAIWYWLRALGNKGKWVTYWRIYYIKCITQKV